MDSTGDYDATLVGLMIKLYRINPIQALVVTR